jgi:thioester reductase-like protein
VLLSKYTGQEDIVVGSPIAGREHADLQNIIGMFVNTLAIRGYPQGSKTFKEFLQEVRENALKAYENQAYQFEELVDRLDIKRDMSRNALFDTMFVLQNMGMGALEIEGVKLKPYNSEFRVAKFDITLTAVEVGDRIEFELGYATKLFNKETIERLAAHYVNVLCKITENVETEIKEIQIISGEEKHKVLYEFNGTRADYPRDKAIHRLFEEQVEKTPDNIAVVYGNKSLTYRELNRKSNQLARVLREKGVAPDSIVGIMLERSLEMIIGIFGILKAGGAYLPIDQGYPQDRIQYMLEDSGVKILLTKGSITNSIEYKGEAINLVKDSLYEGEGINLESINSTEDLAYIIYTSGSTGKPKGVMVTQQGLVNYIWWAKEAYLHNEPVDFPLYSSISFDLTVTSIYTPLISGGRIVVGCMIYKYDTKKDTGDSVPIGVPADNVSIYILDQEMRPVTYGVIGEIYIGGDGVARGYLNRPKLTAEKFVTDPFMPGGRMYRTGDLARWLPDGNIEFLGRIDHQVKIRGYRIELEEIESQLLKHASIKEAVVTAREGSNGDNYLCAHIVADREVTSGEIREHLVKELPDYMIPSYFVQFERMPLTPNGKIDRKALPEPNGSVNTGVEYATPRNYTERRVAAALEQVLKIETVGIHDNFFNLGGDSLKAVRLVSMLSKDFNISVKDIFIHQTVAELAANINYSEDLLKNRLENFKKASVASMSASESVNGSLKQELKIHRDEYKTYRNKYKKYKSVDLSKQKRYRNILLAGSTGYLGIHLLYQLLKNSDSNIYVLVRGTTQEQSIQRIMDKLQYYFYEDVYSYYIDRIKVMNGDISKDLLGLTQQEYDRLKDEVECVINSAANVRHYGRYNDFFEINAKGVERLIDFCMEGKVKDFNQVSTLSVAEGAVSDNSACLFTEYDSGISENIENYYVKTKNMAEIKIEEARLKGLKAKIFRVGNLVFASNTGIFQQNIADNAFYSIVRSYLKIGSVPNISLKYDFSFVDYIAEAIVKLFSRECLCNETYHLFNDRYISLPEFIGMLRVQGYSIDKYSIEDFIDHLYQCYEEKKYIEEIDCILLNYGLFNNFSGTAAITIENKKTNYILEKLGFNWAELSSEHVAKMMKHCEKVNFL